jgi:hypothetical protein
LNNSGLFYKIFKEVCRYFRFILVDIIGFVTFTKKFTNKLLLNISLNNNFMAIYIKFKFYKKYFKDSDEWEEYIEYRGRVSKIVLNLK